MRVLYVNHTNVVSGAAISFSTLLRNLPPEIDRYFLLHRRSGLAERFGADPAKTYRDWLLPLYHTTLYGKGMSPGVQAFHLAKAAAVPPTLAWLRHRWKYDVMHLNEIVLVAHAASARLLNIPTLVHVRTSLARTRRAMKVMEWAAERGTLRFAVIDHECLESMPASLHRFSRIVHNPVEPAPVVTAEEAMHKREEWNLPKDAILAGQVASLHYDKGIWDLLEVAAAACPRNPKLHFIFAGNDNPGAGLGPQLREAIKSRGLEDRVHLVGYQTDIWKTYAALDIVLCMMGRHLRGAGRTAFEAGLALKPLVATIPNVRTAETVKDGVSGLAFEPDDLNGVIEAVLDLASRADKRSALGRSAYDFLKQRHDPKANAAAILELYRELAA